VPGSQIIMMRVLSLRCAIVQLPFRFSFGHALAARSNTLNVLVQAEIICDDGRRIIGTGECVPREYVTGETAEGVVARIKKNLAPLFEGKYFKEPEDLIELLSRSLADNTKHGAAFCAVELAFMDALGKYLEKSLYEMIPFLSAIVAPSLKLAASANTMMSMTYGGVLPFASPGKVEVIARFYKLYGFKTVKVKVGDSLDKACRSLAILRSVLGPDAILRVDANCAWTYDEARWSMAAFKKFGLASIEQPLPAHDLDGLAKLTEAIEPIVIVDESLTSLESAARLIARGACGGFNIRISKVGGILAALKMLDLAQGAGIETHLGAQVGESGILAAAQRHLACAFGQFANVEGAMNKYLLKEDLTREDLTVPWGTKAMPPTKSGLSVRLKPQTLARLSLVGSQADSER
jgi:L-alanine-DL-glutamate epimerase-like enolase superfamily enzyme